MSDVTGSVFTRGSAFVHVTGTPMGTDFMIAVCPMPLPTSEYFDTIPLNRLQALAEQEYGGLEQADVWWEGLPSPDGRPMWELQIKHQLRNALDMLPVYERQWTTLKLGGIKVIVTGGLSAGDPPTDVWDSIILLSQLPCYDDFWEAWAQDP